VAAIKTAQYLVEAVPLVARRIGRPSRIRTTSPKRVAARWNWNLLLYQGFTALVAALIRWRRLKQIS
jgi:hypothetical protein